jgi:hypothetical protein
VLNLHVTPPLFEVFGDKSAVTMMGFVFAAKEASSVDPGLINCLDFAPSHQV